MFVHDHAVYMFIVFIVFISFNVFISCSKIYSLHLVRLQTEPTEHPSSYPPLRWLLQSQKAFSGAAVGFVCSGLMWEHGRTHVALYVDTKKGNANTTIQEMPKSYPLEEY